MGYRGQNPPCNKSCNAGSVLLAGIEPFLAVTLLTQSLLAASFYYSKRAEKKAAITLSQ